MKKEHPILAIPLDREFKIDDIIKAIGGKLEVVGSYAMLNYSYSQWQPQQIIITSDDEIKEGDYIFNIHNSLIDKCIKPFKDDNTLCVELSDSMYKTVLSKKHYKKIIATYSKLEGVPTISLEFLKEWVKAPSKTVMVEYFGNENDNELKLHSQLGEAFVSMPEEDSPCFKCTEHDKDCNFECNKHNDWRYFKLIKDFYPVIKTIDEQPSEQKEVQSCGNIEMGTCDICGKKEVHVSREYYYYGIKCECHSPSHFEIIYYCKDCTPKPPRKTTICLTPNGKREVEQKEVRSVEEIMLTKSRCTITEEAEDVDENYYFQWKDVKDIAEEYHNQFKK